MKIPLTYLLCTAQTLSKVDICVQEQKNQGLADLQVNVVVS